MMIFRIFSNILSNLDKVFFYRYWSVSLEKNFLKAKRFIAQNPSDDEEKNV